MRDDIWVITSTTTNVFPNYYTTEEKAVEVLNDLANRLAGEGGPYDDGEILPEVESEFEDSGFHELIIKRPNAPAVRLTATRLSNGD